jgi:hypothetical protein
MAIELDRRFVECREEQQSDPDLIARYGRTDGTLSWPDLLTRRRIVFLAEAGSGKTTEMNARAHERAAAGHHAFYATVEDVGRQGLEATLRSADRAALAVWHSSDKEGWFFIDSLDEAKQSGLQLRAALRTVAEAIAGAERRAHIVLSGRYTDWQFRRDLIHFKEELAIPADEALPPPPTPDELVISTIHSERREPPPPPEDAIVVVLTGLDEDRVRRFATGKSIQNLDAFIAQIGTANLWQFARRPLDLDWLVQFWHSHKRLGSLAEMLNICIAERLQESNLDRARLDGLDAARAYRAIERIAAAMVFSRKDTVAVPDAEISLSDTTSVLDVADVLPDWSPQDRGCLLTRAVFDPATFGRARIHNDNQGVVRSYLTARWLLRLRNSNLSQQRLLDLMFEETYGVAIIKPTMQEVAAWLSLWDEVVAREVARREPFLLLSAGDPASLSRQTRENLLTQVVERAVEGHPIPSLDIDSLKRFSRPDLAQVVRKLWGAHATHSDVRRLLLRLIWLGGIKECADLAEAAVLGSGSNSHFAVFAGRAMITTGDDVAKKRYAAFVKTNCATLSTTVVWDALEEMVPLHFGVEDLLNILSSVDVTDRDGGLGLDWHGPKLVERIHPRGELERLLLGLLSQFGGTPAADDRDETAREKAYFPMIAAAAQKILELSPDNEAPLAALDAAVRIGEWARRVSRAREQRGDLTAELEKSAARRRLAFWRFAERLAGHHVLGGRPIDSAWDLQMLGFPISFQVEDIDWLLADAPTRELPNERQLAINTAMMIRRDEKLPDDVLKRLRAVVASDTAMTAVLNSWIKPPPKSAEYAKAEERLEESQRRNAVERAAQDKSWVDFAATLRADPSLMRNLRSTTPKGVDGKLFHLWDLLNRSVDSDHRYALKSVEPLKPMIGAEATEGFRVGLIAHWRAWSPWLRSTRKNDELNKIRALDSMGIAGITLEATSTPDWAVGLSDDDARRAVGYATLEMNGFPSWLTDLAHANPNVVRAVLSGEIDAELAGQVDGPRLDILRDLSRGDAVIAELMAPFVLAELEKLPRFATTVLSMMIDIIVRGLPAERERLKSLAIERFGNEADPAANNLYIGAVFAVDGAAATDAVFAKLKRLERAAQPAFVQLMLPCVFGRQFSDDTPHLENLPLSSLERLIRLAFTNIRVEDDNVHPSGVVFSPDERDDAENARNAAFNRLVNTPGRATFEAILRLAKVEGFPISSTRLREFAKERAAKDSESATWKPSEVFAFEETAETEPQTARDLQMVALRRLADMQYDLLHDDFQQGETLAGLSDEKAVQKWTADRLRLKQGRSYSVEREVHVADEKEPDVRVRTRATDASVPLEVKVAETWTLPQLEAALTTQLCDQYLRAREGRHGILLLVHQKPRPRGWTLKRKPLTFDAVVARLRTAAAKIAGSASDAPQPEVAVLNVSSFPQKKTAKKKAAKKRVGKRKPAIRRMRVSLYGLKSDIVTCPKSACQKPTSKPMNVDESST